MRLYLLLLLLLLLLHLLLHLNTHGHFQLHIALNYLRNGAIIELATLLPLELVLPVEKGDNYYVRISIHYAQR